jgi:hypothetical protein
VGGFTLKLYRFFTLAGKTKGKVFINESQYFAGVPEVALCIFLGVINLPKSG